MSNSFPELTPGGTPLAEGALFGRYRIVKRLGEGAMGAVFLAHDAKLNDRPVALKIPKFTGESREADLQRFHREAGIAATMSHPNLCPVYDVGELDGVHFLAMGFIDGKPLNDVLGGKPLAEKQAALLVRKIALAMQAAHDKGVIHRDLKPANIMLDSRKEPIVMDFGLAKQSGGINEAHITQSGMILGTPAYMSPEQVNGETSRLGPPADVYSLGVILYELLTGVRPFQGSVTAVLGQIIAKKPPPPSQHRPGLDPRLEAITLKAMAKKIEDRYADMKQLAAALADYVKSINAGSSIASKRDEETAQPAAEVSLGSAAALIDAAQQCLAAHDYGEAVRLLDMIPARHQTAETAALANQAAKRLKEVDELQLEIELACEARKYKNLTPKLERLLKLKPGHTQARQLLQRLNTYGGKPDKLRFGDDGELLAASGAGGLFEGMSWKYAMMIGVAVAAFGFGVVLVYQQLHSSKPEQSAKSTASDSDSASATIPVATATPDEQATAAADPEPEMTLAELLKSPDYMWTEPENLGSGVNTKGLEMCWGISTDERTLYFSRGDLFEARRANVEETFQNSRLIMKLPGTNSYHGAISGDGLVLVVSKSLGENQPEELWMTTRANIEAPFAEPQRMPEPVNTGKDATLHPALSDDGLTLLALSLRPPSRTADIWMFTRNTRNDPFGDAQHLTEPVSTSHWDMPNWVSNDRTVLIAAAQFGEFDKPKRDFQVFTRDTPGDSFDDGRSLNIPLGVAEFHDYNGSYRLSADGRSLYFYSLKLSGSLGGTDLYVTRRVPKSDRPVPEAPESEHPDAEGDEDLTSLADDLAPVARDSSLPPPSVILTSPDWEWRNIRRLVNRINTEARESSPSQVSGGRLLFFVRDGKPMVTARKTRRGQANEPRICRGPLSKLQGFDVNSLSVTEDGLEMVLGLMPEGSSPLETSSQSSIWMARRSKVGESFGQPIQLPATINATNNLRTPWISADGLTLLVSRSASDRGQADIYQHTRPSRDAEFGPAEHLGPIVNTERGDLGASLSSDGLVLFRTTSTNLTDGRRSVETVMCVRPAVNQPFDHVLPLDPELEKFKPLGIRCSEDGTKILFVVRTQGDNQQLDIYAAERARKSP